MRGQGGSKPLIPTPMEEASEPCSQRAMEPVSQRAPPEVAPDGDEEDVPEEEFLCEICGQAVRAHPSPDTTSSRRSLKLNLHATEGVH